LDNRARNPDISLMRHLLLDGGILAFRAAYYQKLNARSIKMLGLTLLAMQNMGVNWGYCVRLRFISAMVCFS
jgi:hypothetical protein